MRLFATTWLTVMPAAVLPFTYFDKIVAKHKSNFLLKGVDADILAKKALKLGILTLPPQNNLAQDSYYSYYADDDTVLPIM